MNNKSTSLLLALFAFSFQPAFGASVGTSFTYQGRLTSGTNAPSGLYDMTFSIWSASTGATQVVNTLTNPAVGVTNGLFTATLDFGSAVFDGSARWLEVGVRTNGSGTFLTLSPRQALAATPYAQYAPGAGVASAVVAGGVTTSMLADGAVTTAKIGPAAVTSSNIDDGGSVAYEGFTGTARSLSTAETLPFSALSPVTVNGGIPPSFTFTLDGETFGTAIGFVGHEAISEPYEFVVEVIAEPGALNPDTQLARQGRLTFVRGSVANSFAGVVTGCASSSYDGTSALYTFRLEPALSYLTLSTDYKVSQNIKVPDLVTSLYSTLASDTLTLTLSGSYSSRESIIQYGESGLNFFSRLLEDEGIFYFFQQGSGAPALVLGDSAPAFPAAPFGSLRYYGDQAVDLPIGAVFVRTFQRSTRNSTRVSTIRDYDFEKPTLQLQGKRDGVLGQGEDYQFGSPWKTPADLSSQASRREERRLVERATRSGTANAAGLRAGYTFVLDDRSGAGVGDTYLVTAVQHAGFRRTVKGEPSYFYGNQFEVIPAATQFRPAFKAPRPVAQPCPAIVTGPAGEEIHVDKYGRVKVQFYWDRLGHMDDKSSAWVRVASPWAGFGHGMLFLPRVDDEVLVGFVGGNPDEPVVTGSFFNDANMPIDGLPGNKTRSTIKTRSSKGGAGANELMFEDAAGSELLAMTAQKDLTLSAGNDSTLSTGHDMSVSVSHDLTVSTIHDLTVSSGHNLSLTAAQGVGINTASDPAFALKVNGAVAATNFQGSGAGLNNVPAAALTGTLADAQLPANAALRSGGNVFVGPQVIASGSLRMSDQGIFFRGGSDILHGLGWFSTGSFAGANPDGPVLFGCAGGGLGSLCGAPILALAWNSQGNVVLDPVGANAGTLTPGLTFGPSGTEGIASKRSAGGNQSGLDFYTAGTNRLSLTSSGSLGIGTTSPVRRVQIVDADGISGSLQVGANTVGANPKLIYFGDGDYVHIGESGADDTMELKAAIFSFTHQDGSGYVGIGTNNPQAALHVVGNILATGTITPNSDRNAKTDFAPVDPAAVLDCVAKLPIQQWRFKAEPEGIKHVGPMAQDFRAAFGLGENPTAIATVDADGVALAAIQGLNQKLDDRDAQIQALKRQNDSLEQRLKNLELLIPSIVEKNRGRL
jgi:type VI secretion system secreted protein VgrG